MTGQNYKIYYILLIFLLGYEKPVDAQNGNQLADSVKYYAHELIRNQDLQIRKKAFNYLNDNLYDFLIAYKDFRDSLPRYEGLAIQENKDLKIRIVTYQLYKDTSSYEYGGWVQSSFLEKPVLLHDESAIWDKDSDVDFMTLDAESWYGALYYQMQPVSVNKDEMVMLLFGLDNYHFFTKRKILDVLVIRKGEMHFGQSIIEMEPGLPIEFWKKRYILDYSVQAPAIMRYDPDREMIIFDHLVFMPSDIPAQRIMRVPDGTYSGFDIEPKNRKLIFVEKVFDQVMDEAPGGRNNVEMKRDLFGEVKKH